MGAFILCRYSKNSLQIQCVERTHSYACGTSEAPLLVDYHDVPGPLCHVLRRGFTPKIVHDMPYNHAWTSLQCLRSIKDSSESGSQIPLVRLELSVWGSNPLLSTGMYLISISGGNSYKKRRFQHTCSAINLEVNIRFLASIGKNGNVLSPVETRGLPSGHIM